MSRLAFLIFNIVAIVTSAQDRPVLPTDQNRKLLFEQMVDNINRVDGDGLIPRENRFETWQETTEKLKQEAIQAKSLFEFGRVFKRLDATYPNLHAKVYLHKDLDQIKAEGKLKFPFKIQPNLNKPEADTYKYYVQVDEKNKNKTKLQNGDEVLEINDLSIEKFQLNNYIFCKFPFKNQCALELFDNLKLELLGWSRNQDLRISVKRKNENLNIKVIPEVVSLDRAFESEPPNDCDGQTSRYKGFTLEFTGQNLCAYESRNYPDVVVLRIKSFGYTSDFAISYLDAEVDLFFANYWKKKSGRFKTIIFDLIENYGGESPAPYYGIFIHKPYQEMYAQFRKIKEFEVKDIKESFFWSNKSKEIWLNDLKTSGAFDKISEGDFLPPVAQFCANKNKNCNEELFQPKKHNFNGKIKIMVDQWCISSCVGFIENMVSLFKGRVQTYGHYDSGDSAYSRVSIAGSIVSGKVETVLQPHKKARNPGQPEPWIRQVASVTRSNDQKGNLLSGRPQKIDHWIPRKWSQSDEQWVQDVFKKAIIN